MNEALYRWKPAVPRAALPVIAGMVWAAVGIMLLTRSAVWFRAAEIGLPFWGALAFGVAMAGGMIPGVFLRLSRKNLERMAALPERACVFALFAWRSWGIALVMSVLGVTLRRSGTPHLALAGPYLGMGLCLLCGGLYLLAGRRRVGTLSE